jgi:hypothetical protein
MGVDVSDQRVYLLMFNQACKSLEVGKIYPVRVVFDGATSYNDDMKGHRLSGGAIVLSHRNLSSEFVKDFRQRNGMRIYYQGTPIAQSLLAQRLRSDRRGRQLPKSNSALELLLAAPIRLHRVLAVGDPASFLKTRPANGRYDTLEDLQAASEVDIELILGKTGLVAIYQLLELPGPTKVKTVAEMYA